MCKKMLGYFAFPLLLLLLMSPRAGWAQGSLEGQAPSPTPTAAPSASLPPTPSACGWNFAAPLPIPILAEAVTSLGGNLYTFGGSSNNARVANSYRFDGTAWTAIAPLPVALSGAAAVNDGTSIYILGGADSSGTTVNTLYRYDPVANSYTTLMPFGTASSLHAAVYLGGKIYKFGGAVVKIFTTNDLEIYNIATNQWTTGANYPISASSMGAFAHGNSVYGAGGFVSSPPAPTAKAFSYDPVTNTWSDGMADLPGTRQGAAAVSANGGGVLAGGTVEGNISTSVISWDQATNVWSSLPSMLAARSNMNAAVVNGALYVVGGASIASPGGTNDNQRFGCPAVPSPTATGTPSPTPTTPPSATPSPTFDPPPTPTATATATPTPTATPPPSPSTTPTPLSTPTPTPTPSPPTRALNLSTRMRVQINDLVGIGGFIVSGTTPKHVLIRAIGPSLSGVGVPDALADTVLELHGPFGMFTTITNDNWRDDPVQEAAILATGIPPSNDLESAIVATLAPSPYTAVVRGKNNTTGVALVEVYDLNPGVDARLSNISTRAFVGTGNNIVIAGFLLGGNSNSDRVVVRGLGPSMSAFGIPNPVTDPTLELRDSHGALLIANNDWQDDPDQAGEIDAVGLAPDQDLEAAIIGTFAPGLYTALLAGRDNLTGLGLVEVYDLGEP